MSLESLELDHFLIIFFEQLERNRSRMLQEKEELKDCTDLSTPTPQQSGYLFVLGNTVNTMISSEVGFRQGKHDSPALDKLKQYLDFCVEREIKLREENG